MKAVRLESLTYKKAVRLESLTYAKAVRLESLTYKEACPMSRLCSALVVLGVATILAAPSNGQAVPREPMKAAVLFEKTIDGLVIEEVAYHLTEKAYSFGYAIHSKAPAARRPAVVVLPGRLGHYTRPGYDELVRDLAGRGYLVFFVCDPLVGKRNGPEAGLHAVGIAGGCSLKAIQLMDALRGLDYLLTRGDVDPARIGLIGIERGAAPAAQAAGADKRFQFVLTPQDPAAGDPGKEIADRLSKLPPSDAAPLPCGKPEDPDFSMFRFVRQRYVLAARTSIQSPLVNPGSWKTGREELVAYLAETCGMERIKVGPAKPLGRTNQDGLAIEMIELPLGGDWALPCLIFAPAAGGPAKRPAVLFSHDSRQCVISPEIAEAAQRLAKLGYCVILPEHVSPEPKSLRAIDEAELGKYHVQTDQTGRSPLVVRVVEDVVAIRHLAGRADVDPSQIIAVGQGIGALDVCLASLLESRIAGVVSLDAMTVRDWAVNVAPDEDAYAGILPYLPDMLAHADFDTFYAAIAPRPLLLAKLKDGWPKSGFQQVTATAAAGYRLAGNDNALVVVSPREDLEEREKRSPEGTPKQLVAIARNLLPAPPTPGVIGGRDVLKPRSVIDSASGVVWVVHVLGGVEQEFVDGGYHLKTWSFVNDLGKAQEGRSVTPLIFKKEGQAYRLTGIGKTRANTGAGLQNFPFEPVAGSDAVAAGYFFGFYTGDPAGKPDGGVVPFEDGPQDRMTILTLDGALDGQKLALEKLYREQSSYPRTYSIQAVSEKPKQ